MKIRSNFLAKFQTIIFSPMEERIVSPEVSAKGNYSYHNYRGEQTAVSPRDEERRYFKGEMYVNAAPRTSD
jgi:hypothetical protein